MIIPIHLAIASLAVNLSMASETWRSVAKRVLPPEIAQTLVEGSLNGADSDCSAGYNGLLNTYDASTLPVAVSKHVFRRISYRYDGITDSGSASKTWSASFQYCFGDQCLGPNHDCYTKPYPEALDEGFITKLLEDTYDLFDPHQFSWGTKFHTRDIDTQSDIRKLDMKKLYFMELSKSPLKIVLLFNTGSFKTKVELSGAASKTYGVTLNRFQPPPS